MANFRTERLFIRVNGELNFDPNEGIDTKEFAFAMLCDSNAYDRASLQDYAFVPFARPKWFRASEGLLTVRSVIKEEEAKRSQSNSEQRAYIERKIEVLRAVEDRLDLIDLKGYRFYFIARDSE